LEMKKDTEYGYHVQEGDGCGRYWTHEKRRGFDTKEAAREAADKVIEKLLEKHPHGLFFADVGPIVWGWTVKDE